MAWIYFSLQFKNTFNQFSTNNKIRYMAEAFFYFFIFLYCFIYFLFIFEKSWKVFSFDFNLQFENCVKFTFLSDFGALKLLEMLLLSWKFSSVLKLELSVYILAFISNLSEFYQNSSKLQTNWNPICVIVMQTHLLGHTKI